MLTIGCKLPHGYVLELNPPKIGDKVPATYQAVVLNGTNKAKAKAKYGTTLVDPEFWAAWLKKNVKLRYLVDGSIFVIP